MEYFMIMNTIEIDQIDLRFEKCRLKDKTQENALLTSILGQGVRDPLQCVASSGELVILLDGFKRLRCSKKLGLEVVPIVSLGKDEAAAILQFIRLSTARSISILEQAALVDELKGSHSMSNTQIAHNLECSKAWVSLRLGLINEMSPVVKEAVFSGAFPVRSYMYALRKFTRVNKIKKSEVDDLVQAVSGKGLSIRDIGILVHGFFNAGPELKEQIRNGNLDWTLEQIRAEEPLPGSCEDSFSGPGKRTISDLELAQKYMNRIISRLNDPKLKSSSCYATAHLLVEGILSKTDLFLQTLRRFYDQAR